MADATLTNDKFNIEEIEAVVNKLYEFRDKYFEKNGLEKASSKAQDVETELSSTIEILEKYRDSCVKKNKCYFYLHIGRALNVTSAYNPEAQEYLSKAVKLDPKLVEGWNHLGECYWKTGNVNGAKNCFSGALAHERNKVSLRNLSMTLRQLAGTAEERKQNVEESVKLAKEAVKLDITDGTSWLILGNAYLASFFTCGQNPKTLKNAMTSFNKAEKDPVAAGNPDLFFNKATAFKYEEEYQSSLAAFERASALDPSWEEPATKMNDLVQYLDKVQDLILLKGKLNKKKLQTALKTLTLKNLGPYSDGQYKSPHGQVIQLNSVQSNDLSDGINANKVVLGCVVCSINSEDDVPFTFCMVDRDETCFSVTVYNLALGKGVIIGDSVAIPEPYLTNVNCKHHDKLIETSKEDI